MEISVTESGAGRRTTVQYYKIQLVLTDRITEYPVYGKMLSFRTTSQGHISNQFDIRSTPTLIYTLALHQSVSVTVCA